MKLTKQEGEALIQLIDIAVKTAGLSVAQSSLYLVSKIQEHLKTLEEVKEEPKA
jgi:hypothetical protein